MTIHNRKRILLADDDESLLRMTTDFLEHEGFEVIQARDGKQALARMDEALPNLLILDVSMPIMGGLEVLKRIQKSDGGLLCPVLVLTARAAMSDFFNGIAVDAFLAKPVSQDELMSCIRRILAARGDAQPGVGRTQRMVLIGASDPHYVEILQGVLRRAGYDPVVAETGPDVLAKALADLPDAILMSEILPGMNGSVVASLTRSMPRTRLIPVVLYDESRPADGSDAYAWKIPTGVVGIRGRRPVGELLKAIEHALGA